MAIITMSANPGRILAMSVLLGVLVFILPGCNRSPSSHPQAEEGAGVTKPLVQQDLRKVRLLPYWVTTAQFAGYYIGLKKGIFKKHGIDLEIIPFNPNVLADTLISKGHVDFGLLWLSNALEMRERGVEIVNVVQFSHRSSLMLLTKRSSGITSIQQMNGRKAAIWSGYEVQPLALFKQQNVKVEIIPIGSSNNLFLNDAVEIINANWFDEYHAILNSGYEEAELNRFFFADYGLNFLEDGLYCLSSRVREDPELCAAFAEAALESWMYAFQHMDETIDEVMRLARLAKIPTNRSHQLWMLNRYRELYIRKGSTVINTELSSSDYNRVVQTLLAGRLLSGSTPYDTFVRNYRSLAVKP